MYVYINHKNTSNAKYIISCHCGDITSDQNYFALHISSFYDTVFPINFLKWALKMLQFGGRLISLWLKLAEIGDLMFLIYYGQMLKSLMYCY